MDYKAFVQLVAREGQGVPSPWPLADSLAVLLYFLTRYKQYRGEDHPPVRAEHVRKYIHALPYFYPEDEDGTGPSSLEPEDYPTIIYKYFQTEFPGCDYRMAHFFSGEIRELRYYETR